jgi:ABC-type proline/glycine betaine transport system ATPase subunit
VTHDRDQARRLCDRIAVIHAGRLLQHGTAMEVLPA